MYGRGGVSCDSAGRGSRRPESGGRMKHIHRKSQQRPQQVRALNPSTFPFHWSLIVWTNPSLKVYLLVGHSPEAVFRRLIHPLWGSPLQGSIHHSPFRVLQAQGFSLRRGDYDDDDERSPFMTHPRPWPNGATVRAIPTSARQLKSLI